MSKNLTLNTSAFNPDFYTAVKLDGTESINQLFSYSLILKTPDQDSPLSRQEHTNVDLTQWLGHSLSVCIELDGKTVERSDIRKTIRYYYNETIGAGNRYINGTISSAQYLYDQGRSSYYKITLTPFLINATLTQNCKIFQDKNVIEILDEVLKNYSGSVIKRLNLNNPNRYPKRDYQTMFLESDYQFFTRLASEWGINFWFEHDQNGHSLILSDDTEGHLPISSEAYHQIAYYPKGYKTTEEYLFEFNPIAQIVSGTYTSNDYDYSEPDSELLTQKHNTQPYPEAQNSKQQDTAQIAKEADEIYEYAADVVQPKAGPNQDHNQPLQEQALRSKWQLERIQQNHFTASAKGNIRGLTTGHYFTLEKHPNKQTNTDWVIRSTHIILMDLAEESQRIQNGWPSLLEQPNNQTLLSDMSNQKWFVECQVDLVPANICIRPTAINKPKGNLQTAIVVGDQTKRSLYTDYLGRIKVQFHWDRYGQHNENSSCWVRVNEPWAGNQMGAVFTPRVGQEVLIDFINNDPDLPVCIGKVNNANNLPCWQLTENQSLSGFRSRELGEEHAGNNTHGRSNHLIFDDTQEHIQTQLKSDHAHSQLSLGDIVRVEDHLGRKEARGQGFELRTDDWGALRSAKGLYISTFAREQAQQETMDAQEAVQLLKQSHELSNTLSKSAQHHQAEPLTGAEHLNGFLNQHLGSLQAQIDTLKKQLNSSSVKTLDQSQSKPNKLNDEEQKTIAFDEAALIISGPKSIALATTEHILNHSEQDTLISTGQNLNFSVGKNLLASIAEKISYFAHLGIKIFSGTGKIELQAQDNDIDLIAKKVINLISTEDWIKLNAPQGIILNSGGSYLKLQPNGIELGSTGPVQIYASQHNHTGPKSVAQAFQDMPQSSFNDEYTLLDEFTGEPLANYKVVVTRADGTLSELISNSEGKIQLIKSEFPEHLNLLIKGKVK